VGYRSRSAALAAEPLTALSLGGTALGRIVGILAAGSLPPMIVGALILEIGGAGVAVLLMNREHRVGAA